VPFIDPSELPAREPRPGWNGRFFHSDSMTFAYYEIAEGSEVHLHHHPQEEVWHIIEGALEVVVGDAARVVRAGQAAVVPAGVEHSARAAGPCRAIVVEYPLREFVGGIDIR
jgi:mannose-6-phosphate isomerase-like protein (cupin superfamily)